MGVVEKSKGGRWMRTRARRGWPIPILAALGLVMVVVMASASTAAPQAVELRRAQLSTWSWFAAYPDIDVGSSGLVAVVWTEGPDEDDKHNGPLKLAWVNNDSAGWTTVTVDGGQTFDAAVAVSGATVHVVWSRPKNAVRYTTCSPPSYGCAPSQLLAVAEEEALQVDIVVDEKGTYYVVWVEEDNQIHYRYLAGPEGIVVRSGNDQEGPAIAYANGFVHFVWTEWLNTEHTDSVVKYRRWDTRSGAWTDPFTLAQWTDEDYRARNLSITADGDGNVYVVWDMLSLDDKDKPTGQWNKTAYAIGYAHSNDNGQNWRDVHTYPNGSDHGERDKGAEVFKSTEDKDKGVEYSFFLRPYVSLAVSGTLTLPILSWHRQAPAGGVVEPGLAQALGDNPYQALWTYATRPGSNGDGIMFWAQEGPGRPLSMTLSTDYFGRVDRTVDSATAHLAAVGDLSGILDPDSSRAGHLHAVYHEGTATGFWGVIYNNDKHPQRFDSYLPLTFKNAGGGGGGEG